MYPRVNYEMTEADMEKILDASQPVPYFMVGGYAPRSPQENANRAWADLGRRMGFDYMTVRPIEGKGNRYFSAVPTETQEQRAEREKKEQEGKRQADIARLRQEIKDKQDALAKMESGS